MSEIPFIGFLNNTAMLLAFGVIFGTLHKRSQAWKWGLVRGILLGVMTMGVMANPWQLGPGMIFDTRTILLSVGGMFFGTVPALIATLMAGIYRMHLGGVGALTGTLWVATSGLWGLAWMRLRRQPAYRIKHFEFFLLGLSLHIVLLLLMFTMPNNLAMPILQKITLPILVIFPAATVLLAKLLSSQEIQDHQRRSLDRSEKKYRELVQHSQVILLRVDTTGRITFFNEYAQDFFGFQKHEILGRHLIDTIVPKQDTAGVELRRMVDDALQNPSCYSENENENICRDGRRVRVLWRNTPLFNESGESIGVQSIGHDVTELRRAEAVLVAKEEQLSRLIDITPVPLMVIENWQTISYVNRCFSDVLGYTLEDLGSVDHWWQTVIPDSGYRQEVRLRWENAVRKSIDDDEAFVPQEARLTCKDGNACDIVAHYASIGKRAIVALNDVTQERELNRMKSEFIATAAHELRTPLSSVKGFSELLLNNQGFEEQERREFLQIIFDKSEALQRIIDDLLNLGRIETGRVVQLEKSRCNLEELIRSTLNLYRQEYTERAFEYRWQEGAPSEIALDPNKIVQVLDNLICNAVKFSPESSSITLRIGTHDGELSIAVCDDGYGMNKEQVSRAFDRFYRADSSDSAIPGLGLGMAIAKGIIEAHGGKIWIDSLPGVGTTVTFTLPLTSPNGDPTP